jgi:RNA polymerase sigma factor (TIGR02999 family)
MSSSRFSDPTPNPLQDPAGNVTQLLQEIEAGRVSAQHLLPVVYQELRKLAAARMRQEASGQTLQPTALVHEAYLRLVRPVEKRGWDSRAHFFAAAAEAMRRILVENARRKSRLRHGGEFQRVDLTAGDPAVDPEDQGQLLALDEALEEFAAASPQKAELVKLRYFAGLTEQEAAEVLGISRPTAARWWAYARAWLYDRLGREPEIKTSECSSPG